MFPFLSKKKEKKKKGHTLIAPPTEPPIVKDKIAMFWKLRHIGWYLEFDCDGLEGGGERN